MSLPVDPDKKKGGKRRLSILSKDKQLLKVSAKPSKDEKTEKSEERDTKNNTLRNSLPNLPIEVKGLPAGDSLSPSTRGKGELSARSGVTSRATSEKRKNPVMFTLPNGTFFFVSEKDAGKTLEVIYHEICVQNNIPSIPVYASDRRGTELSLCTYMRDLSEDLLEILFMKELDESEEILAPDKNLTGDEFHFVLPNGALSKKRLPTSDLLANVIDEVLRTRGYVDGLKPEEFMIRDMMTDKKLSIYKDIHELTLEMGLTVDSTSNSKIFKIGIEMIHDTAFKVCLPDGQKSQKFDPSISVQQVMAKILMHRPEISPTLKVYDENGKAVDQDSLLSQLPSKVIFYGIHPNQWQKTHGLVNPERKAARKEYSFFLPGGILHRVPVEQIHTKKFSEAVEGVCRLYHLQQTTSIKDLNGNTIDGELRMGESSNMKFVCCGIDLKVWSLKVFTDKLLNNTNLPNCKLSTYCRGHDDGVKKEGSGPPTQFRVFLPGGQISSNRFDPTKTIRDVLERLKDARQDLKNATFVPTDLKGAEVPPSMTEQEIEGAEVCYGTDILDWVMIKENEVKQKGSGGATKPKVVTVNERVRFVELLLWKLESMGVDNMSDNYQAIVGAIDENKDENVLRWNNSSFWYLENKDYDDGYLLNKFKQDEMYYSWNHSCPFNFLSRGAEAQPSATRERSTTLSHLPLIEDIMPEDLIIDEAVYEQWYSEIEKKVESMTNHQ